MIVATTAASAAAADAATGTACAGGSITALVPRARARARVSLVGIAIAPIAPTLQTPETKPPPHSVKPDGKPIQELTAGIDKRATLGRHSFDVRRLARKLVVADFEVVACHAVVA